MQTFSIDRRVKFLPQLNSNALLVKQLILRASIAFHHTSAGWFDKSKMYCKSGWFFITQKKKQMEGFKGRFCFIFRFLMWDTRMFKKELDSFRESLEAGEKFYMIKLPCKNNSTELELFSKLLNRQYENSVRSAYN